MAVPMTFLPIILWGLFESLDILGYKEIKLLMSLQGSELFTSLLDWNWPSGS
jgi:hypothetical protein